MKAWSITVPILWALTTVQCIAGDIRGTWTVAPQGRSKQGSSERVIYGPGRKAVIVFEGYVGPYGDFPLSVTATGTYSLVGNKLRHKYTKLHANVPALETDETGLKDPKAKKIRDSLLGELNSETYEIRWIDADSFEASMNGMTAIYHREGSRNDPGRKALDDLVDYNEHPGFLESAFFWMIGLGLIVLIVLITVIRKLTRPSPPPRMY